VYAWLKANHVGGTSRQDNKNGNFSSSFCSLSRFVWTQIEIFILCSFAKIKKGFTFVEKI
jgi:hypothetical protein